MLCGGAVERIPGKESSGSLVEELELVAHKLEPTKPDECAADEAPIDLPALGYQLIAKMTNSAAKTTNLSPK